MDIARPEFKVQKRRQMVLEAVAVVAVAALTFGVSRLKPEAPTVERGTVWTDIVKRGPMVRQVRGTLVPTQESVRQILAETETTVLRIHMLPGSQVEAGTILLEMSNPQTEQAAVDAQLQVKAAEAMVTHNPRFAKHADREVHLFDGKVVAEEELKKLLQETSA